jgi:hypothetical protein
MTGSDAYAPAMRGSEHRSHRSLNFKRKQLVKVLIQLAERIRVRTEQCEMPVDGLGLAETRHRE